MGAWAGSQTGGYPSMINKGNECLVFYSFEKSADSYGIGLIRLKSNQPTPVIAYDNLVPSVLTGTTPIYSQNNNLNAKIELTGNTVITMPDNLKSGQTGNIKVTASATSYTLTLSGYPMDVATNLNSASGQYPLIILRCQLAGGMMVRH